MKKAIIVMSILASLFGAYAIGYIKAEKDVMNNQIITNEREEKGFYQVEYKGQLYSYWYE